LRIIVLKTGLFAVVIRTCLVQQSPTTKAVGIEWTEENEEP